MCCLTCSLCFEDIPDVAGEVVVASTHKSATLTEVDGGDAADDVVVRVKRQFLICSDIKQSASSVVRPSRKRKPVREKLKQRNTNQQITHFHNEAIFDG